MTRRTFHRAPEAERRHDLIEATLDCIAEFGLEGATVRQIAVNGLLDGLWLEGCLAGELFEKDELVDIALTSIEALLGQTIDRTGLSV